MMMTDPTSANGNLQAAGGYGPPGGGGYPPPGGGGGGYGGPPGGGGYGGPPGGGPPPGGGGYGGPPGGGGYGGPPGGGPPGYGGPPQGGPPPGGFGGGPQGGGFGPPGGFPPPGGPMMPGAGGDVNTTLPLILNIVALVLCWTGCIASILAIVGIVFSVQAGNMKKMGDMGGAAAKAKTALTMGIVALALGFVLTLGGAIFQLMSHG